MALGDSNDWDARVGRGDSSGWDVRVVRGVRSCACARLFRLVRALRDDWVCRVDLDEDALRELRVDGRDETRDEEPR